MEYEKLGEACWGLPKEGQMRVPVRLYAKQSMLAKMSGDRTFSQVRNVATLPGIVDAAMVMPDGHEGFSLSY